MTKDDMVQKTKVMEDKSFQDFMARGETKLMLSLLPNTENKELMPLILRAAFDAGCGAGAGGVIGSLLEGIISSKRDKPPREF